MRNKLGNHNYQSGESLQNFAGDKLRFDSNGIEIQPESSNSFKRVFDAYSADPEYTTHFDGECVKIRNVTRGYVSTIKLN